MRDGERGTEARFTPGPNGNGNRSAEVADAVNALRSRFAFEVENRQFTRISTQVPVEFKFFSNFVNDDRMERVYRGTTTNISAGGLLLKCLMPDQAWIPDLLLGRVVLGIKIQLPGRDEPVKAMARVAWIEDPGRRDEPHGLGIRFREITRDGHDRLLSFIIDSKIPD